MIIKTFGTVDDNVKEQLEKALSFGGAHAVLCADNHLGYSIPVGGVVAYEKQICVNGVGFDIACGNKAVRLDCDPKLVKKNISSIMDEIFKIISFGMGRNNNEKVDHPIFYEEIWEKILLLKNLKEKARNQLGTVGGGNHYVDVFIDEMDHIWVGCHFGSRGFGHSIATHFIKEGKGKDGINADPVIFDEDSDLGEQYLKCMGLAGRYAYAGRDWVCSRVAKILGGEILEEVHNHHNFAWKEKHFDKDFWVVRKGATPAFPGQKGFVGGSMGEISVILEGVESTDSELALYSTIHGAGRLMGRTEAKGKIHRKTGKVIREGKIKQPEMDDWVSQAGVELRGGDLDEAPQAYKRIKNVLAFHRNTINILHMLYPIGVAMAPKRTFDPYKD